MKTNNLILMLLVVAVSFLLGSTYANQAPAREDGRTEEYLLLHVIQDSKKNWVSFIVETEGANEYKKLEKATEGELLKKLHSLNSHGFELFDTNYGHVDNTGDHHYTYIFKRKL